MALTGTPGVGKTTVSEELRSLGHNVVDLNSFVHEKGLTADRDEKRDTWEVDPDEIAAALAPSPRGKTQFIDGHLSHLLGCNRTVLLRCAPVALLHRLEKKGWSREKVEENVEAEILDIIKGEIKERLEGKFLELDTTQRDPDEIAQLILGFVEKKNRVVSDEVDWHEAYENWIIQGIPEDL